MVSTPQPITIDLEATPEQQEIVTSGARFLALFAGRRWGKLLHVDTMLPTPTGYVRNGDVADGQQLIGSDGNAITVEISHPIKLSTNAYELTFDDGEKIVADAGHLWSVTTSAERKNASRRGDSPFPIVVPTEYIAHNLTSNRGSNFAIPVVTFAGSNRALELHPYMLGVWLGDGTTATPHITCGESKAEILIRLRSLGYDIARVSWNRPKSPKAQWCPTFKMGGLAAGLRHLGLIGNKHIPEVYFLASIEQRMELLRGMMDTDGYTDGRRCELCLSDERLAVDAFRLIKSLGIKARMAEYAAHCTMPDGTRRAGKNRFRIVFYRYLDQSPVFMLERKQQKIPKRGHTSGQGVRYIVACEKTAPCQMRCLTVDADDALYCATQSFVLTHNTVGVVRNRIVSRCLSQPGTLYLFASPSYAQCKEEFDALSSNPGFAKFIRQTRTQPFPKIDLFNGSQIYFRSLDRPQLLRGGGFNEVWVDEVQDVDETSFDMVLRPLVADKRGTLGVSGQFRGTEDWRYKRCFLPGQDKTQAFYRSWRYATDTGYCFRSEEGRAELERIKATMPAAIYDQEFDCIPTANQRALFRTADLDAMRGGQAKAAGTPGMGYVIGLDIGRVVDPGSWVAYELETNTVVHAEVRPKGEKHEVTASYMGNASNRFQACPVVVDCTGGATGGHAEQDAHVRYYRDSIPEMRSFYWSRHNKEKIIHGLALAIEQRKFKIAPECTELFKQLAQYEYEYKGGHYDFHATQGCHDDLVSALAMAWDMVSRGWTPQRGGVSLGAAL